MTRPLVICADDYGLAPATSAVIAGLAAAGRLNAVSCMTDRPGWAAAAQRLRDVMTATPALGAGLHLTLSERPMDVVAMTFTPQDRRKLGERIRRQLDDFIAEMERPPHFVDGHHHAHLAPAVREALFDELSRIRFAGWIRQCRSGRGAPGAKRLFLDALSRGFASKAQDAGYPVSPGFGGLRAFAAGEDLPALWRRDLAAMRAGGVLMVHPGADDDAIGEARVAEARLIEDGVLAGLAEAAGLTLAADPARPWPAA